MFYITQGIGLIGLIILIFSYQINDRKKLLLAHTLGNLVFLVHFFLLGAFSGLVGCASGALRNIIFYYKNDKKWAKLIIWPYIIVTLSIIFTIMVWEGYRSIFPIIGTILICLGMWSDEPKKMRRYLLLAGPPELTYSIISLSIGGIIMESMLFISCLISIIRYDLKKNK